MGKKIIGASASVLNKLMQYDWPGNVRELQHLVERTLLLTAGGSIHEIIIPGMKEAGTINYARPISVRENEKANILSILKQCNFGVAGKAALQNSSTCHLLRCIQK